MFANLAPLAQLSSHPGPHEDTLPMAVDGNAATSLLFVAGSDGEGSLTLQFPGPRPVSRIRLLQGHSAYYSTAYQIVADKDGDGEFETTLVRAEKAVEWGQWTEHRFAPVQVTSVQLQSIQGVSQGKRAHPAIYEIEVYGDMTTEDYAAMMQKGVKPTHLPVLKPLFLDTEIVTGGKAKCALLAPDDGAYRELGATIAASIAAQTGVGLRVVNRLSEVDLTKENVIALGQMLNNKLIERLYWNNYVHINSLSPGGDGYVIQTVHNPYPWVGRRNVVVLGGSSRAGVERAVQEFLRILPKGRDIRLPYTLKVELPPPGERETDYVISGKEYSRIPMPSGPLSEGAAKALVDAEPQSNLLAFQEFAMKYLVTGEAPYLVAGKRVLEVMSKLYEEDPQRHPTWPEETNSRFIFAAWDAVEESSVFDDAERLRYTNLMLRFLYSLVVKISDYGMLENNDTIIWNHTTFPLLGLYGGGRYFRYYYNSTYMDEFLHKAAGAFRGQKKCWKPQCDADSYLTLTIDHTMEYALAENKLHFFESGNIRDYAEYLIGICDNTGLAAGFGDSGIQKTTQIPDNGLPYAFWYTKDPRYLGYLNAIHKGKWLNPYHQDVPSGKTNDHVGLRVFPLHRMVYDYTASRSYYGEPVEPPNVPFEQAFDKIAFRENLDPQGQYFVLDGYARGKHLHYDGNSILKLTDKGYDWLIDGDYLVRNTTEHNMISVLRDGRCEQLVPVCSGLLHHADLPTRSFTETVTREYNGVDWHRNVFWEKGGWIVLMDRLTARTSGEYKFDNVFKCIDEDREELVAPDRFRISRGGIPATPSHHLSVVSSPAASGGKAVMFGKSDSRLQLEVNLKQGEYRLTLYSQGVDTGSDSLWVQIDDQERIAFHLPLEKIGPSSATAQKTEPSPTLKFDTDGEHVAAISLRENPGPVLDRLVFEEVGKPDIRLEIEAEAAPAPTNLRSESSLNFNIVNADFADQWVKTRTGSSGPVKCLFQRKIASLEPGEEAAFLNLLYIGKRGEISESSLHRIDDRTALLGTGYPALVGVGDYTSKALEIRAAMYCVSPDRIDLVNGTSVKCPDLLFAASEPVSVELDLQKWIASVTVGTATTIRLKGVDDPISVQPGTQLIPLAHYSGLQRRLQALLATLKPEVNERRTGPAGAASRVPELKAAWHTSSGSELGPVRDFTAADIDGDGKQEVLVIQGNQLSCRSFSGEERWSFAAQRDLRVVTCADVRGDGTLEVLCGGEDEHLYVLDSAGKQLTSHKMTELRVVGQGGTYRPYLKCIVVQDLDGNGENEVIVGTTNCFVSVFDQNLHLLWSRDANYHGVRKILATDLDGDGRQEVLAANHYGGVAIYDVKGRLVGRTYSELGDVALAVGDIDGDGKPEIANGSSTGVFTLSAFPTKTLFSFNNHGYAVREVAMVDLNGDGHDEVLIASDTGYVYALDREGKTLWRADLGSAVVAMTITAVGKAGQKSIVVGQQDGSVQVLDLTGRVQARHTLGASVGLLRCADINADGHDEILAASANQGLVVLHPTSGR
ncbi:MAG: hypothetical protein COS85_10570 [Armatimonadetes bacterium CG07_land_8_20_14_0_80_59_28]|nr:MAG: hypothetical protein COS85_10570 [Armatimonadetes bacterium CG07_land_8_20_14_0_80_59_28]PIX41675.1 MAG: hypothetical protein COZ56_11335 [Armatimonadetes bacterium CG_4_8_14_3_um_filter_58_9]PIY41460.1 MAG: hypothetical protein COZ05_15685 [Armatimonadetes bacterium CG_4_10_14_3_um_filter_59_10]PJB68128.1 MAG: hypothetical protein CO095_11460 [Armatimonadetes bacterium CG_4_9_14_3_um_filter_58_7]